MSHVTRPHLTNTRHIRAVFCWSYRRPYQTEGAPLPSLAWVSRYPLESLEAQRGQESDSITGLLDQVSW